MPVTPRGLLKTVFQVSPWVVFSKLAGFCIPFVIAHLYGIPWVTDTFFYILAVPTFIVVITANAASNVFVPALTTARETNTATLSQLAISLAFATAFLACLLGVFMGAAATFHLSISQDESQPSVMLALKFGLLLLPYIACVGMNASLRPACDVLGEFTAMPVAGILRSVTVIATLMLGDAVFGILVLPLSFSIGECARTAALWVALRRILGRMPLSFHMDATVKNLLLRTRLLWVSELLIASTLVCDKLFASWLDSGQLSVLEYADKLRLIPQLFLEGTLLPIAFASWASLHAQSDRTKLLHSVQKTTEVVVLGLTPVLCLGMIWRTEVVDLLFGYSELTAPQRADIADLFGLYLPGVWLLVVGAFAFKIHVLYRRWHLIILASACAAVTNVALNLLWIGTLGLHGIVLASLVAWALLAGIYQWTLRAECTQTSYGLTQPFLLCVGCMTVVSVSSMSLGNKTVPMAVLLLCVIAFGAQRLWHRKI